MLVLFNKVNEFDDLLYRGGFLVISLIAAVVIAVLAHPASRLGSIVGCKPCVGSGCDHIACTYGIFQSLSLVVRM